MAKAVGEKREAWKMIEGIRDRGEQPSTGLKHLYGQKKKAARRAEDRARRSMEEELYRKIDEDGVKKMTFRMARERTEDGRDVKRGAVIQEGTYEKTTAREGASEEFEVKIGLRQGSWLSPLLFIAVLDLISRKTVVKDAMKKLLYADDLALVANGKQELQETLEEWNGLFTRHGLKINVEKTEVLHIGLEREELDIELEGKKLTQGDSFVYLGGAVCGDGKTEREVCRRVQAGAIAWKAVEVADLRTSKRLKGKVMSTCVTPAWLYGTETLALTELQQQRLQVCENNWVRKMARVTRADRRRMVELREETGVQRSLTERLVRSRLQWVGHVERMADDRLPKRAAELCEQGRRRRGRPRLRWEDCVKRDVRKAGEEEDWKKKTRDRGGWKRLSYEAVKKLRAASHP